MRSHALITGVISTISVVVLASCAATSRSAAAPQSTTITIPAPAALQPPAQDAVPEIIPLERGETPDGWQFDGPVAGGCQFSKGEAAIEFLLQPGQGLKATGMLRKLVEMMSARKGVTVEAQVSDPSGNEAELAYEDVRIGVKHGRVVIRCFPDRTSWCMMTAGLWPAETDDESSKDFDVFLTWVRLK